MHYQSHSPSREADHRISLMPLAREPRSLWQQWSAIIDGRWLQLVGMALLLLAGFAVAAITVAAVSSAWWL